jgi:hypothetical protein
VSGSIRKPVKSASMVDVATEYHCITVLRVDWTTLRAKVSKLESSRRHVENVAWTTAGAAVAAGLNAWICFEAPSAVASATPPGVAPWIKSAIGAIGFAAISAVAFLSSRGHADVVVASREDILDEMIRMVDRTSGKSTD